MGTEEGDSTLESGKAAWEPDKMKVTWVACLPAYLADK